MINVDNFNVYPKGTFSDSLGVPFIYKFDSINNTNN